MMTLKNLLADIYPNITDQKLLNRPIESISCDSRSVEKNSLFIALKGHNSDGNQYISAAIEKGASVIVSAQSFIKEKYPDVCFLQVKDPAAFLRLIAERFYQIPSEKIKVIGITGTNGKTTITYLIESILKTSKKTCGVIGTVNYRIGDKVLPSVNTTPGFLENQKLLRYLADEGIEYCVMEVSSHALDQNRVDLIDFKAAVFTNLTSDHLDYHQTRQKYFEAKAKLFNLVRRDGCSVINVDDEFGRKLVSLKASAIWSYGIHRPADIMARDIDMNIEQTKFTLDTPKGSVVIRSSLLGEYNIYNILAAAAVCLKEGISLENIQKGIENLQHVPGRLEKVACAQDYSVIIDYAHTQDALENVLKTLRAVTRGKILLVFGCGGDRDRTKRPEMGRVASHLADYCVVTSDNPRNEEPQAIIDEIVKGMVGNNYSVVVDRR
ncbi:MAG: UDP-N-acetylmuramoyl-L-alanyl-D-glutamate--2,6-diaminopimelate ligase, partial [Candidatus Omnitrophica bacterium]|nr:UDP-N-acetylmuramoyl-L-alanyl-D-glutamate--2,6-diaminopimelate ligase [Candidatus Omnitrophota bacterium]